MPQKLKKLCILGMALGLMFIPKAEVQSAKVIRQNLAQLTEQAEYIFMGKVVRVTDGFDENNLPYTEITFDVKQSIKGNMVKRYGKPSRKYRRGARVSRDRTFTFRQFGLLKPRDRGNGVKLALPMGGFPHYEMNEEVMLFLYKEAARSGFRTTVGLFQGKFTIVNGKMVNAINNRNLFVGMNPEQAEFTNEETRMLTKRSGPVDVDMCVDMVSRAVKHGFFKRKQWEQPQR